VAGNATFASDAASKDKSSQDLERLVFGDNFGSRLKAPKSNAAAEKKKSRFKDHSSEQTPIQMNKKNRSAAAIVSSDDGDSSDVSGNVSASSDDDARGKHGVNLVENSARVRAPAWQDEDDDAVQACANLVLPSSRLTLAFRWTYRANLAPRSCGKLKARQ
jgi:hypothetical protein